MIQLKYLQDCKGATRFGACSSCGKGSQEDKKMVRIIMYHDDNHKTSFCLCDNCRREMYKKI